MGAGWWGPVGVPRTLGRMFEVTAQTTFNALHAIVIDGQREPLHGHDWLVRATIAGPTLDGDGLLCDFHAVEAALERIAEPWRHRSLNDCEPFRTRGLEPTAEHVAFVVAQGLASLLRDTLPRGARVARVRVTEAPHCVATYAPPTTTTPTEPTPTEPARTP